MKPSSLPSSGPGFSLIELMIVLAIAGILATIAVPSFSGMVQNQRVRAASFELFSSLSLARSEAIKRNSTATITFTKDPTTNEYSWVVASGGTTIRTQSTLKNIAITPTPSGTTSVTYNRTGRTSATSFQIDAAGVSSPTQYMRCVSVELSGMPRTSMGACTP